MALHIIFKYSNIQNVDYYIIHSMVKYIETCRNIFITLCLLFIHNYLVTNDTAVLSKYSRFQCLKKFFARGNYPCDVNVVLCAIYL